MNQKNSYKIGIPIVLLAGSLWGLSGVLGQLLFQQSDVTIALVSIVRMLGTGIVILTICAVRMRGELFAVFHDWTSVVRLLFFSGAGVMAVQYTYFAAIAASNAATGTVLQYTYPILILLYTAVCLRKLPSAREIAAILFAFMGIILISTHGSLHSLCISTTALCWGLSSAVAFVIYTISPQPLFARYGILPITGWGFLIGGLLTVLVSGKQAFTVSLSGSDLFYIAGITVFGTLIPFLIYGYGVRLLGNVKASLFATVEPVVSAILAFFLAHVSFTAMDLLGFACILGAIETVAFQALRKSAS